MSLILLDIHTNRWHWISISKTMPSADQFSKQFQSWEIRLVWGDNWPACIQNLLGILLKLLGKAKLKGLYKFNRKKNWVQLYQIWWLSSLSERGYWPSKSKCTIARVWFITISRRDCHRRIIGTRIEDVEKWRMLQGIQENRS